MKKPLTVERVEKAFRTHFGILKYAADALGCSRPALYSFLSQHPELEEVRKESDETLLDIGEKHLSNAIKGGDLKTIRWHLERKGKERGYVTRAEQTGKDGEPLQVERIDRRIVDPDEPAGEAS